VSCLENSWEGCSAGRKPHSPAGGLFHSCCDVEDCPPRIRQPVGTKPLGLFGQNDLADGLQLVA
jgi:hypothetical protein